MPSCPRTCGARTRCQSARCRQAWGVPCVSSELDTSAAVASSPCVSKLQLRPAGPACALLLVLDASFGASCPQAQPASLHTCCVLLAIKKNPPGLPQCCVFNNAVCRSSPTSSLSQRLSRCSEAVESTQHHAQHVSAAGLLASPFSASAPGMRPRGSWQVRLQLVLRHLVSPSGRVPSIHVKFCVVKRTAKERGTPKSIWRRWVTWCAPWRWWVTCWEPLLSLPASTGAGNQAAGQNGVTHQPWVTSASTSKLLGHPRCSGGAVSAAFVLLGATACDPPAWRASPAAALEPQSIMSCWGAARTPHDGLGTGMCAAATFAPIHHEPLGRCPHAS